MKKPPEPPEAIPTIPTGLVEVIQLGKDEMNLAEFPITLLTDRVPKDKKTIQYQDTIFDEKLGKRLTRKLTISADDVHGLPTAVDDDVILGLIQLTKNANNFTSREVAFSRLDLIHLLGWSNSGESYRRLAMSLKRWLSVTLLYENAWRDNQKGAWITKGFHILDNIELNDTRTINPQGELFPTKITWNKVVFDSFAAGYLKTIDYGLYINLKLSVSRRMYRFLSKRLYFGPVLTFDLRDLAFAHIGLSDSYSGNAGKIKEKLQPAIDELVAVGFLEPMSKEQRYQKDGKNWKILFSTKADVAPLLTAEPPPPIALEPVGVVAELVKRGITEATAKELASKHPAERIEAKIEVFDWLMGTPEKPKRPAGWLVKSIHADWATPTDFVSRDEQRRRAEARELIANREEEDRRNQRRREESERAERQAIVAFRKSLTPERLREHEAKALSRADAESRASYDQTTEPVFRRMLLNTITDSYIVDLLKAAPKTPNSI